MLCAGRAAGGFGIRDPFPAVDAGGGDGGVFVAFCVADGAFFVLCPPGNAGRFGIRDPFPAVAAEVAGKEGVRGVLLHGPAGRAGIVILRPDKAGGSGLQRLVLYYGFGIAVHAGGGRFGALGLFCPAACALLVAHARRDAGGRGIDHPFPGVDAGGREHGVFVSDGRALGAHLVRQTLPDAGGGHVDHDDPVVPGGRAVGKDKAAVPGRDAADRAGVKVKGGGLAGGPGVKRLRLDRGIGKAVLERVAVKEGMRAVALHRAALDAGIIIACGSGAGGGGSQRLLLDIGRGKVVRPGGPDALEPAAEANPDRQARDRAGARRVVRRFGIGVDVPR